MKKLLSLVLSLVMLLSLAACSSLKEESELAKKKKSVLDNKRDPFQDEMPIETENPIETATSDDKEPNNRAPVESENPTETSPNEFKEPSIEEPVKTEPDLKIVPLPESEMTYFSLTCTDENGGYISLSAYPSFESEGINIEMQTDVLKMGIVDASAMATIYERAQEVNFGAMNGMSAYTDGNAYGDFYIEFADGTVLSGMFGGVIPAEFNVAMGGMIDCFEDITADFS